jgi:Outer membrane protein beta-barrel domain
MATTLSAYFQTQAINLRHLLYIHRREMTPGGTSTDYKLINLKHIRFLGLLVGLLWAAGAQAQYKQGNFNYLDFQSKNYYFGITLGYNMSDYRIYHSNRFIRNDSFTRAESVTGPGFNLGIVSNLKIGDYFDVRFLPTLSFAERNIRYSQPGENAAPQTRRIESVLVETPFHIRYKSAPYHDFRLFVIGGVKYVFDVASDSRSRQAAGLVKIAPTDFQVEFGAGIQFFFPYFIFSPELKVSHGLNNVLLYNNRLEQSTVLEKVLTRTFTISLHFEG